jgi:hypothetical protein
MKEAAMTLISKLLNEFAQWSVAEPALLWHGPRSSYFMASGQIKHLCNDKQIFIPFYSANTVVIQARARQALAWACE